MTTRKTIIFAKDFGDAKARARSLELKPNEWVYANSMESICGRTNVWLAYTARHFEHPHSAELVEYAQTLLARGFAELYPLA